MTVSSALRWIATVALLLAACGARAATPSVRADELIDALRGGGYVVYFRHAQTDWSLRDNVDGEASLASCDPTRMRQLSDEGRATARAVGAAMARLRIPVAAVHASEYCRCVQTAELLGLGPVQRTRDVLNRRAAAFVGGEQALAARARRRLATPPPPGSNVVLVAHGNVFRLVADSRPPEGGAAIVRPRGDGHFDVVGTLSAKDWIAVATARSAR